MKKIHFMEFVKFWRNNIGQGRVFVSGIILCALIVSPLSITLAKEVFPDGDITYIVNSEPGGGNDLLARGFSQYFTQHVKEVVPGAKGGKMKVENVTGGAGSRAYIDINQAAPDGTTIGGLNVGQLYEYMIGTLKLPFDPGKFTFLFACNSTMRVIATPKKGYATWEAMLAGAKKEPVRWCVGQYGSAMHLESIYVKETVGIPAQFIPMAGSAKQSALFSEAMSMSSLCPTRPSNR
jgi:tripartite-type tricarboxylate transporter receptor subunit TctC